MSWQGLLHGAQNSTRKASLDCETSELKVASPTNLKFMWVWLGFTFSAALVAAEPLLHASCQRWLMYRK
jgi:hypothetical protein